MTRLRSEISTLHTRLATGAAALLFRSRTKANRVALEQELPRKADLAEMLAQEIVGNLLAQLREEPSNEAAIRQRLRVILSTMRQHVKADHVHQLARRRLGLTGNSYPELQ